MRRLIVTLALSLSLLGVTPAWATVPLWYFQPPTHPPVGRILGFTSWQHFIRWQGCDADVVVVESDRINAGYSPGRNQIWIFQGLLEKVSEHQLAFILAHESGHCLQVKGQMPWLRPPMSASGVYEWERDAEAHGVMILRTIGYDGAQIGFDLRMLFSKIFMRDPAAFTPTHGSAYSISEWASTHDGIGRLDEIQMPFTIVDERFPPPPPPPQEPVKGL